MYRSWSHVGHQGLHKGWGGLTLFPGGPDGPGSPVGPGDPWFGERKQSITKLSHQDTQVCCPQPRKHRNTVLSTASPAWPPLGCEHSKSTTKSLQPSHPAPSCWHSETPTHILLLHLEQRGPLGHACAWHSAVWSLPQYHHPPLICRRAKPEPKAGA